MAGGQGTRFWPWSTAEKPKQFLAVVGKEPLLTQTYKRLKKFIHKKNIFIIADGKYLKNVQGMFAGISRRKLYRRTGTAQYGPGLDPSQHLSFTNQSPSQFVGGSRRPLYCRRKYFRRAIDSRLGICPKPLHRHRRHQAFANPIPAMAISTLQKQTPKRKAAAIFLKSCNSKKNPTKKPR